MGKVKDILPGRDKGTAGVRESRKRKIAVGLVLDRLRSEQEIIRACSDIRRRQRGFIKVYAS